MSPFLNMYVSLFTCKEEGVNVSCGKKSSFEGMKDGGLFRILHVIDSSPSHAAYVENLFPVSVSLVNWVVFGVSGILLVPRSTQVSTYYIKADPKSDIAGLEF